MKKRTLLATAAIAAVAGLALAGCAPADETPAGPSAEGGEITIAVFNGWDEGIASSLLWEAILEDKGYDVTLEYSDVAPLFSGLSSGDYDFATDVWLPTTHAAYIDEFGDDIVDLGSWFDSAALTVAVNEDAPITSLTELAENADAFGNRIVGIEPGAGLTAAVQDSVIPTYGLEGMEFTTSSTIAMLAELQAATDAGENIVVTLWEPHWAYGAFPIRNLEDPEGTLGTAEEVHAYSRAGFADDFPEVAGWLEGFEMPAEQLYDLENLLFNENQGVEDKSSLVAQWIADNQEYVDGLTS